MSPEHRATSAARIGVPDLESLALIAEYAALRAEIMHRITNQLTIVGGNIALLTIAFTSFKEQFGHATVSFELLLAPIVFIVVAWWFFQQDILIAQAASYLHKALRPRLEARLDREFGPAASAGIMQWESHRTELPFRRAGIVFEFLDPLFRLAATLGPGIAVIAIIYLVTWSRPEFLYDASWPRKVLFAVDSALLIAFFGIPWYTNRLYQHVADERPSKNSWLIVSIRVAILQVVVIMFLAFGPHPTDLSWPPTKAKLSHFITNGQRYGSAFVNARDAAAEFAWTRRRNPDPAARAAAARGESAQLAVMYAMSNQELCTMHDYFGMMDDIYGSELTTAARRALRDVENDRADGLRAWARATDAYGGDVNRLYEVADRALDRSEIADQWLIDALQTVSHRVDADVVRQPINVKEAFDRSSSCGHKSRVLLGQR